MENILGFCFCFLVFESFLFLFSFYEFIIMCVCFFERERKTGKWRVAFKELWGRAKTTRISKIGFVYILMMTFYCCPFFRRLSHLFRKLTDTSSNNDLLSVFSVFHWPNWNDVICFFFYSSIFGRLDGIFLRFFFSFQMDFP